MFRRCRYTVLCSLALSFQLSLLAMIYHLIHQNANLKTALQTCSVGGKDHRNNPQYDGNVQSKAMPSQSNTSSLTRREVTVPRKFTPSDMTIVLYRLGFGELPENNLKEQLAVLKQSFPGSVILLSENKGNLGKSLNSTLPQVKTQYFLLLESHVSLSDRPHESIASLWDALEQFPELDFVGGSYLSKGKLYVPCSRFRLCRWTFSESYEYERSLENVMICEGISSSFMGRTNSIKKVKEGFDGTISDLLVVKDYLFRAKGFGVVAGTRPSVMFLTDQLISLHQLWKSQDITGELVPFAIKHKVFIFKDIDENVMDLCSPTSPLSGKGLCIETNSHKLMLSGGHWAYRGIFTYPYLLKYLEITLAEMAEFFDRKNVTYVVEGGVSLGAIKMRSILPWDSGDVDIIFFGMSLSALYDLIKPWSDEKGYVLKNRGNQLHVFCTPKNVGDLSGGLGTFHRSTKSPSKSELIKIKTNGVWVTYRRSLVPDLVKDYGQKYLQHRMHGSRDNIECKIKGHNACIPNFKSLLQGRAGNLREYYCEI